MKSNDLVYALAFLGFIIAIVAVVALVDRAKAAARRKRYNYLLAKYGDPEIVKRIMTKTVWVGETSDQLLDSLGQPADTDEKVLKTKRKQIWKYAHQGGNRYGLRITVENDAVVGWHEKL